MADVSPLLVAAVVRRGAEVLLVRQYGPSGPSTTWALPGGRCEPGELVTDAVRREVAEETGLVVAEIIGPAYVAQLANPTAHRRDTHELPVPGGTATVVAVEVTVAPGDPSPRDPDGFVTESRWVPAREAARLLAAHPLLFTGAPAAARVAGSADAPASLWQLVRGDDGLDVVLAVLAPSPR